MRGVSVHSSRCDKNDNSEGSSPVRATLTIQESTRSGTLVCKAAGLSFGYAEELVVDAFSTTILRGDKVGFVGPNGCGKTTLLRLLLEELEPQSLDLYGWEHN